MGLANLLPRCLGGTVGQARSTTFSASLHQQREINDLFCVPPSTKGDQRTFLRPSVKKRDQKDQLLPRRFPPIKILRLQLTSRRGLIDYAFRQLGGFIFLLFQVCKLKI